MAKRGRPPLNRPPDRKVTAKGLTVGQEEWLSHGWQKRGFESAAHYLRYIVDSYIERVEAEIEEDRFTPKAIEQLARDIEKQRAKRLAGKSGQRKKAT